MGNKGLIKSGRVPRLATVIAVAALVVAWTAALAPARMSSTKISTNLCETTGGGWIVKIPSFPGERIDRRLLNDIRWLERKYKIFITDGYSNDPAHAANGEHPLGLALDIIPNKAAGGSWRLIGELAEWAEPKQNRPRAPFRWVGYRGDAGHGPHDHLHLSYAHSPARVDKQPRTVQSVRCPGAKQRQPAGDGGSGGSGTSGGISPRLAPLVTESGGISAH